jgi:hypothetical protein
MTSASKTPPLCAFHKDANLLCHQELGIVPTFGGTNFDDDSFHGTRFLSTRSRVTGA